MSSKTDQTTPSLFSDYIVYVDESGEPRRVVPLCKSLADEIGITYRNALKRLANLLRTNTPKLSKQIESLLVTPSLSNTQGIPFFFFLTENGIEGISADITLLENFDTLDAYTPYCHSQRLPAYLDRCCEGPAR